MTRIDIERRTESRSSLLWWVLGLIALVAVGMVLWLLLIGRGPHGAVEPGAPRERRRASTSCPVERTITGGEATPYA